MALPLPQDCCWLTLQPLLLFQLSYQLQQGCCWCHCSCCCSMFAFPPLHCWQVLSKGLQQQLLLLLLLLFVAVA
jgi:hypothetical protein